MGNSETAQPKPVHLLVFPFPPSSHVIPLVDLTRRLLTRHHNHLTVTFLITEQPSLSLLKPLIDAFPPSSFQPLLLSPPHPLPPGKYISGIRKLHILSDSIISWFNSHPSPPDALLADFFVAWTHSLCASLRLPRVVFYPSGAFSCAVMNSMWQDSRESYNPDGDDNPEFVVRFDDIPGSPRFKWSQLGLACRGGKMGGEDWEIFREEMGNNIKSWGAVFNSFYELESAYIDHYKKQMGHDRVWAVGPLLPEDEDLGLLAQRGWPSAVPAQDVLTWLDGRPDCAVVYVCFGTVVDVTKEQTAVLGAALECSKVHFIWCLRQSDDDSENFMPDSEYEDRVAGRGFIIRGWAPQLAIVRHRAVGAFLTHCGWNSVLEAVSSGVMMLAWPREGDQYTDAHLAVDQLGLGLKVQCHGPDGVPDPNELAQLFVDALSMDRLERARVMKLRGAVTSAVNDGSSTVDLDSFVKRLSEL